MVIFRFIYCCARTRIRQHLLKAPSIRFSEAICPGVNPAAIKLRQRIEISEGRLNKIYNGSTHRTLPTSVAKLTIGQYPYYPDQREEVVQPFIHPCPFVPFSTVFIVMVYRNMESCCEWYRQLPPSETSLLTKAFLQANGKNNRHHDVYEFFIMKGNKSQMTSGSSFSGRWRLFAILQ